MGAGQYQRKSKITQKILSPSLVLLQVSSLKIVQPQQMYKLNSNDIINALNVEQCLNLYHNAKLPTLTYLNSKGFGNRFNIAALRECASQLLSKGNSWQTSSLSSN